MTQTLRDRAIARKPDKAQSTDPIGEMIRRAAHEGVREALADLDLGPQRRLLTITEATVPLNFSEPSIRQFIRRGMPVVRALSVVRIDVDAALDWLRAGHGDTSDDEVTP